MKILFLGYDAWGDWISYNGLIRYLSEKYEKVYINLDYGKVRESFVRDLFKDNKKIEIYSNQKYDLIVDAHTYDQPVPSHINKNNKLGNLYSHYTLDPFKDPLPSNPSCFYHYLGLSDDIRTQYFYFSRNVNEENSLFNRLNLIKNDYIAICQPPDMKIKDQYLSDKKIINIHNLSPKFTDTLKIIENASEVHLTDTSPSLFVYHLQYKNLMDLKTINFHSYARMGDRSCTGIDETNIFTNYNKYYNNNLRCINAMLTPKLDNWNFIWS